MKTINAQIDSIDTYIAQFPDDVQARLQKLRTTILNLAPGATEAMSYQIPTFKLNGNLVHFAAFKKHIGFYPGAAGIAAFQDELAGYKSAKGSVQFPLDQALPLDLVKKIVKFRVIQNLAAPKKKS
ncbi:MAG: DUF1801 domain-containing protein [Polaromonas sp.]|nr:DUF1801 domain-containing protein [Polaromonas sp.]NMD13583.1 hypothetical protein [Candidatus Cloacimonadota bacterium]MBL0253243.1 DUF1801 domain-containing protein [Polaromonas sp.]MBP6088792.1 DUF1801 domain-containing protein [Polaromonas sp.]MBP6142091.1 DUF1801 domain-containing protein [Polaromonas sp.]